MPVVQLDCPHDGCLTEKAGFSGGAYLVYNSSAGEYIVLLQCGVCRNCIIAKFQSPYFAQWLENAEVTPPRLIDVWPKRKPIEAPQHLPPNVARYYFQTMDSLNRRNFDAAGTMFRKALDTGLKRIDPQGKGTLEKRIDNLSAVTGITPAMKEWAHHIRRLGNDAAHEEEPFEEDEARGLQSFTELLLTYAFTLPGMLVERYPPAAPETAEPLLQSN
jgi:hypothetical protein